jgi:hypothetical protein
MIKMRASWPSLLAILICVGVLTQSALAQIIVRPHTAGAMQMCGDSQFYDSRSPNAPKIIANSFRGKGSVLTFRVCKDADANTHYFVREPRPIRNGICRTFEVELFPGTAKDGAFIFTLYDGSAEGYFILPGWKDSPPSDWEKLHYFPEGQVLAQQQASSCPEGDDKGYIPVTDTMTDGMLNAFFDLWRNVSSSPSSFDKAFLNTKSDGLSGFKEDHAELVQKLRSDLFDKGDMRPTLELIRCEIGRNAGCSAFFNSVEIGFDVTDTGMQITRIDPIVVP